MKFTRFFVSRPARGRRKEENIYTHIYSKALRFNPYKYVLLPSTCFVLSPLLSTPLFEAGKTGAKTTTVRKRFNVSPWRPPAGSVGRRSVVNKADASERGLKLWAK